jgi:hypothetical protein
VARLLAFLSCNTTSLIICTRGVNACLDSMTTEKLMVLVSQLSSLAGCVCCNPARSCNINEKNHRLAESQWPWKMRWNWNILCLFALLASWNPCRAELADGSSPNRHLGPGHELVLDQAVRCGGYLVNIILRLEVALLVHALYLSKVLVASACRFEFR